MQRSIATRAAHIAAAEFRRISIVVGIGFAAIAIASVSLGFGTAVIILLFVLVVLVSQLWYRGFVHRRIAPAVRLTLLSEVCCPSCAYDLRGLPPVDDSCTPCPECHAAWAFAPEMLAAREARERITSQPLRPADEITADRRSRDGLHRVGAWFGWRRTFAIRDARGRMVELVNVGPLATRPPFWKTIPRAERRRLWLRLYCIGWPFRLLIGLCSIPAVAWAGWAYLLRTGPSGFSYRPISVAFAVLQGVLFPLVLLGIVLNPFTRTGKPIVRAMLRVSRCPACAASLPLDPAQAGEVTCPECLASWSSAKHPA